MTDGDLPFVASLYASTRREELADTGWPQEMQDAFLRQQHEAQHSYYRATYDGAEWLIIEQGGAPVGRLYRVVWPREIRIIDISLVPDARGSGIGGAILGAIQEEARGIGKAVSIHVEKHNRARNLYLRLGFEVIEDKGVYDLMEWRP
ncbi:GNAT family N-acetyltransferase [Sphingosinicella sp. YJ22]|uniref:GNAT family N-acetyltransferase n=1 Tax=Sphingosinicella sp. YJ22 TaxID=1104780 RepID=UPI00140E7652|nr:GNAT family N-acetyltransferase [Sphingosinicella sp. YJ22]